LGFSPEEPDSCCGSFSGQSMEKPQEWAPSASRNVLQKRAELLRAVRKFFDRRGFLEVETPLLSADTVVDRHLDPFVVSLLSSGARFLHASGLTNSCGEVAPTGGTKIASGQVKEEKGGGEPGEFPPAHFWLQTSPEFPMKRLLAAGFEAVYQVTKAFRAGERGPLHNPEFTIVEWYRVGQGLKEGMLLLSELCQEILKTPEAEFVSYGEVFRTYVGLNPHTATVGEMATVADLHAIPTPNIHEDDLDTWRDVLFAELVQPHLGRQRPTIVYGYPKTQSGLARLVPGDPPVAARFELFVRGMEIANGYYELTDADELIRRFQYNNGWRVRDGKQPLPERSRLEQALRQSKFPDCCGCALGFDRLVMLTVGAKTIDEVIAFPWERA
jgi:lysyl-tRNA synthetase class 2